MLTWLEHDAVHVQLHALHASLLICVCGEGNYQRPVPWVETFVYPLAHFVPVHIGHWQVKQQHRELLAAFKHCKALGTRVDNSRLAPQAVQEFAGHQPIDSASSNKKKGDDEERVGEHTNTILPSLQSTFTRSYPFNQRTKDMGNENLKRHLWMTNVI
jgi:hypothetical protein